MSDSVDRASEPGASRRRPGPQRGEGAPSGPDEVRTAVLDAAEELFAERGVENVSLRDVAAAADVHLTLIGRYVGRRDDLVSAVFVRLAERLAAEIEARPLASAGFEPDSAVMRWMVVLAHFTITGTEVPEVHPNPVEALAQVAQTHYGLDETSARVRAAQIVGSALGWRMFEPYLCEAAGLTATPIEDLRGDLLLLHRRAGSMPWPTPDTPPSGAVPSDPPSD